MRLTAFGLAGHSMGLVSIQPSGRFSRRTGSARRPPVISRDWMTAASGPRTRRRLSSQIWSVCHLRTNVKMKKKSATFRSSRTRVTLVRMAGRIKSGGGTTGPRATGRLRPGHGAGGNPILQAGGGRRHEDQRRRVQ